MPVRQVEDRMGVEPNELYVIPPGTQMTLVDGLLHLAPRQKTNGKYQPGDMFFKSLAADRGSKAIAVVLSGTDGDGSQGLQAVKVAGGVTFAQCEATAQFSSMPETAVATGNVDFVLPPEAIAAALAKLSRSPYLFNPEPFNPEPFQVVKESFAPSEALTAIFARLRTTTGVDFTAYKPNTLNRRMLRRMMLYQFETLEDYAQYLQAHPEEVQALYEEILIHVTRFFRDPEVFEQLKAQVFPTISQNKASDTPLRLWVAGCSTGEEVYSLAICLLEFFHDHATVPPIQLFATDISEAAISKRRPSPAPTARCPPRWSPHPSEHTGGKRAVASGGDFATREGARPRHRRRGALQGIFRGSLPPHTSSPRIVPVLLANLSVSSPSRWSMVSSRFGSG
jgi:hypothetical protein